MQTRITHVKCNMCGEERDFGEHFNYINRWRHKILVEVHGDESHRWGYEERELDLCPKCYGRCVAIKALEHEEKEVKHNPTDGRDKVSYAVISTEYTWKDD